MKRNVNRGVRSLYRKRPGERDPLVGHGYMNEAENIFWDPNEFTFPRRNGDAEERVTVHQYFQEIYDIALRYPKVRGFIRYYKGTVRVN